MDRITELKTRRARVIADLRSMTERYGNQPTAEQREALNRVEDEARSLQAHIDRTERLDALAGETRGDLPVDYMVDGQHENDRDLAFQAWCQRGINFDTLGRRCATAAARVGISPNSVNVTMRLAQRAPRTAREARMLSALDGSAGGFLMLPGVVSEVELALLEFGGVREVADVVRTETGLDYPWPTCNDTARKGRIIKENGAISPATDPSIGAMVLKSYGYTSDAIYVPREIISGSPVNLVRFMGALLGERIGRITAQHFTTGTGSGQPSGIVTQATTGKTCAAVDAITSDEVRELMFSVGSAYRRKGRGRWMCHDDIALVLAKLKDTTGAGYVFRPGETEDDADMLLGRPITYNGEMASTIEASAVPLLFGDLSKYKIRDVGEVRLHHMPETSLDLNYDTFMAYSSHDGALLDAGTHPVKKMVMAAA